MLPESALDRLRAYRAELKREDASGAMPIDRDRARDEWQSAWRRRHAPQRSGDRMFPFFVENRHRLPIDWHGRKASDPWLEIRHWLREANRVDAVQARIEPQSTTGRDHAIEHDPG